MRNLFTVAAFTMKDMVKRKSFIVSNIIIILMIIIGTNIPNIINAFVDTDTIFANKILIIDEQNIFEGSLETLNDMLNNYSDVEIEDYTAPNAFQNKIEACYFEMPLEDIKSKIEANDITAALIISKSENTIKLEYIVENAAMTTIPENYINALSSLYTNIQLSKLNLSQEQLQSLAPNFEFTLTQTDEQEVGGDVVAIMLLSLVLFFAIYFFAYQVSTSITTEKTSKIMETLVTSTTPKVIVLGKTLGIGLIGLA